jgi:hypothetical protein
VAAFTVARDAPGVMGAMLVHAHVLVVSLPYISLLPFGVGGQKKGWLPKV